MNTKKMFTLAACIGVLLFSGTATLSAQPMLPSNPAQAPVDGGLTAVALAGGLLAWRKLQTKRSL
jgi:hypothetical protein